MLVGLSAIGAELRIQSAAPDGAMTWSGAYTAGVCTVEATDVLAPPSAWTLRKHLFTSNALGGTTISVSNGNTFCRLLAVDISTNTPRHFTNLVESYGIL